MGRLTSVFFVAILILAAVFYIKREDLQFSTPVPKIYGATQEVITVDNTWFPNKVVGWQNKNASQSNLSAKSAIIINYDTKDILFAKNADERLPAASTIKIMTALVALESSSPGKVFTVSKKAAEVGEDSMNLTEGEKLNLEELLYGMMLASGNDAAITIAEGIAADEDTFVEMMNKQLKKLGLSDTKFVNASGLDEDNKTQYTTAYDLAVIAHYAWDKYPLFRKIVSTEHMFIEENGNHKAFDLYNETNLLTTYPGVQGIKPGFTWDAGWCLVTYAENNGKRLLAVILGSEDRRGEMKELLDYGFAKYGIKIHHPGLDL